VDLGHKSYEFSLVRGTPNIAGIIVYTVSCVK
jgi:hypothetical protein